jgi:predicted HD phosphohydrolase
MDLSTAEQWAVIGKETFENQGRVAERSLDMLRSLAPITDGFAVDQLTHSLQTATLAERAGADEEMVFASLMHDIGKAVSVPNHPEIAASIIRPYVRDDVYEVIRAHQDFQGRHYYHHFGGDPNARDKYEGAPWFALAAQFADEWDQIAFDPDYDTLPLEHFEPLVREKAPRLSWPRGMPTTSPRSRRTSRTAVGGRSPCPPTSSTPSRSPT